MSSLKPKTYYNDNEGHTYWSEKNNLMSAPTMRDGSIQEDATMNVRADYTIPLSDEEEKHILMNLIN